MNYKYRLALAAVVATSITACSSGADSRRQAAQDFNYLNTPSLESWTLPAGAQPFSNTDYTIPQRVYQGEVGTKVDIRPPLQVLELIPGVTFAIDQQGVTLFMPSSNELMKIWRVTQQLITDNKVGIVKQSADRIDTDWVSWTNDDEDTKISSRYTIEKSPNINSYRITLTDWREDGKVKPVSVDNKRRYSILMTNLVMAKYDNMAREQARIAAAEQLKNVPIMMGTDRSGLPIIIARAPYDDMWERLPIMLQKLGFTVEDRNRSQGLIDVKYRQPDDAFWTKLGTKPMNLTNDKYRILVGDLGNRTSLNITDNEGKPVTESVLDSIAPVFGAAFAK
ncbi:outer membrane protein assembly factor BamC [Photobacterium phosphoreum]|jgi:outer membrane protein assembly factor BamC|uniref:Outer membrane protein assembly factor BamC n=1 Tax=Photobacterium phosphoreum TaxID=659 RepID=A0A2T3PI71_PHOPO|nr:outer membrane protein assembly factor BamC [Photobacterium phosphoreum]KJF85601.1 outer membrane protein assembly factor BamC [Photobacterium phosphoreum]MCD9465160.1 outer membrane protein assembly factor BamC [Photobacterium phosphoreum]MCD9472691.1 outer membrane protein assembly factor BamC [Photobacterium phosphoreum]MCD9476890.1 outer membrane protein assembly factor BamC [Photobacterium phosphoreum]MCD9481230.1 outer membrane protein assembly factor BamC [Photobacterium phosphoreum]